MLAAYNALHLRPGAADGASTFTLNVLPRLAAEAPEVQWLALVRAGERRIVSEANLATLELPVTSSAARVFTESVGLERRLRSLGVDVLVSPNESIPLRFAGRIVVVAQNLVYHCSEALAGYRGNSLREQALTRVQTGYYRVRMRRTYRRADVVVCVSDETRRMLVDHAGLDEAKTVVAHEGADSLLLPEPRSQERARVVLAVSTLAPYKGFETLIDAFALAHPELPDVRLVVAGGDWRGYARRITERVALRGIAAAVDFRAAVGYEELAGLYDTSLLLVHLSWCESFGLPVAEAMRYGLPVIAGNRSSLPEVAGGAALLVDPQSPQLVAEAIVDLARDDTRRAELSRLGLERSSSLRWSSFAAAVADAVRG